MARSTSNTVWNVVFVLLAIAGVLAAVFGPSLYREGKAFVAPIAEQAGAEKAMEALDEDFPFEPPADGLVPEERLAAVDSSAVPRAAGTPAGNQELFSGHRDRIALIEVATHNPLHETVPEKGGVRIEIEDDGRPSFLFQPGSSEPESTR